MTKDEMIRDYNLSKRQIDMDKYILKKEMCGLPKGTIFVHDTEDEIRGSIAKGCLKLAWADRGQCQSGYCGGTFVLHASVRKNKEWFELYVPPFEGMKRKLIDILESTLEKIKNL
jgi:hypothetical protein